METLQEKIISLELTQPNETLNVLNGNLSKTEHKEVEIYNEEDEEPVTPTTPLPDDETNLSSVKKKKRKRSKKGKH